jgi:hypothetical protein
VFKFLRRTFSIQPPKSDASDCGRFFADVNRASEENVDEARAFQRRISEQYIKPIKRRIWGWLWNRGKRLSSSSHRHRWGEENFDD